MKILKFKKLTSCGSGGYSGSRSMTTLRGGGGKKPPGMLILIGLICFGFLGGASRMTKGFGGLGLATAWRMIIGGAGLGITAASWVIMIGPGAGGVGGLNSVTKRFLMYSTTVWTRLIITCGSGSVEIGYSLIGISPFHQRWVIW